MAFYCFLVFFIIALFCVVYYHPNLDKIIGSFILVVLIVIGGLRDRIGWDYFHYKEWYLEGTRD